MGDSVQKVWWSNLGKEDSSGEIHPYSPQKIHSGLIKRIPVSEASPPHIEGSLARAVENSGGFELVVPNYLGRKPQTRKPVRTRRIKSVSKNSLVGKVDSNIKRHVNDPVIRPGEEFYPFTVAKEAMKNGDHIPEDYEEERSVGESVGVIGYNFFDQLELALVKATYFVLRTPELMRKIGKTERDMDYSGAGDAGQQLGIGIPVGVIGGAVLFYLMKKLDGSW